jgi:hypothetical protein
MNQEHGTTKQSIVDNLFDVGEAWTAYGLKIAELALQTSARTLTDVSKLLGNLADELKRSGSDQNEKDIIDIEG